MINFVPIPTLFSIGNFHIFTFGVIFIISFLVSLILWGKSLKGKLDEKHILNIAVLILLGVLIGTRLLYVFINFPYYWHEPLKILAFNEGGSSSFGGFLAVLFVWLYARKNKIKFSFILDTIAPYLTLALALGRLGCFFNWDDFGIASILPWAVKVPGDVARHPTQIYLLIANLIVFFILLKLQKRKEKGDKGILSMNGSIFLFFILYYAINRFFIDFLRAYQPHEFFFGLVVSQWFSLIFIIIASLILIKLKQKSLKSQNRQEML